MTIWVKWHKPWAPLYSLDLGVSIIFSLIQLDSDRVSLEDTPKSVNHSLNSTFVLQHPALAARWWKCELGGAEGRENVMVSGKSHPKPATWLHFTTAFVVLYPQKETIGDAEQMKELKAVVPGESVQKKTCLEEVVVMGTCEPKSGAISSFVWGRSQAVSVPQLPSMVRACWDGWSAPAALPLPLSHLPLVSFSSVKHST